MVKVLNAAGGYNLQGSRLQGLGAGTSSDDAVNKSQLDGISSFVRKTSTQSRQSTTTPADDSQLLLSVVANATYLVDLLVIGNSPTNADFKFTFSGPSGASLIWATNSPHTAQTNFDATNISLNKLGLGSWADVGGFGSDVIYRPSGVLYVSSTAGTLTFMWSQSASVASDTSVKADSYLRLRRMA